MPKTIAQLMEELEADRYDPTAIWGPPVKSATSQAAAPAAPAAAASPKLGMMARDPFAKEGLRMELARRGIGLQEVGMTPTERQRGRQTESFVRAGAPPGIIHEWEARTRPQVGLAEALRKKAGGDFDPSKVWMTQAEIEGMMPKDEAAIDEQLEGVTAPGKTEEKAAPKFGKTIEERISGVKSEEDELKFLTAITEALGRAGEITSPSQLALGLEPQRTGVPGPMLEELQALSGKRRALEERRDTPEWDPASEVSKFARETAGSVLGRPIPETISAGQIREQLGGAGSLFTEGQKLQAAARKEARLPNQTVDTLLKARAGLSKLKNVDEAYKAVMGKMGPIRSRINKLAKKIGWDDPEVSLAQAELRDAFAKYLYGTSGKQLSNREIDFMAETAAQDWMNPDTFKEILKAMRRRLLEEYNATLVQHAANGRDIEPHLLPGWSFSGGQIQYGEGQKVKVPKGDTAAIEEFKKRGIQYEVE